MCCRATRDGSSSATTSTDVYEAAPRESRALRRVRYIWEGALRLCHLTSYLSGTHHNGFAGAILFVCQPQGCHPPLPPISPDRATLPPTIGERHQSLI